MKKIFFIFGVLIISVSAASLAENHAENQEEKSNEACKCVDDVSISQEKIREAERSQGHCEVFCYLKSEDSNHAIAFTTGCACFGGKLPTIIFFSREDLPLEVVGRYDYKAGKRKPAKVTLENIQKNIDKGTDIEAKYFTTKKGLKLGMSVDDVVKIYGEPHEKEVVSEEPAKVLVYKWKVLGKMHEESSKDDPEKKICPEIEVGFDVSVTFEGGKVKLIKMGYHGV